MKKLLPLLAVLCSISAFGQQPTTTVRDLESWAELSARKEILDDKVALDFQQEFRFNDNSTQLSQFFSEFSFEYRFPKEIELGGGYRFKKDRTPSGDFKTVGRWFVDLGYSYELDRWEFGTRIRWQREHDFPAFRGKNEFPTVKYRWGLDIEYNIKGWKWDPYLGFELFYRQETLGFNYIDQVDEITDYSGAEKLRFTLGTSNGIGDVGDLDLFFRVERELDSYPTTYQPATYFIIGTQFRFNL